MNIDLDILAYTFEAATRGETQFAHHFYAELVERHPICGEVLGGRATRHQERMLARAMVAVLAHLDDPAWLHANLTQLGRKHEQIGVELEMYEWFATCLIDCLAESAGCHWLDGARDHWRAALDLVVRLMAEGYESEFGEAS